MVIYYIDMVILDIDMGYGPMIWEMTESMWSSAVSIWDMFSLWPWLRVLPRVLASFRVALRAASGPGLTLVHFSAELEPCLPQKHSVNPPTAPNLPLNNTSTHPLNHKQRSS
jgi:hypothetical protein